MSFNSNGEEIEIKGRATQHSVRNNIGATLIRLYRRISTVVGKKEGSQNGSLEDMMSKPKPENHARGKQGNYHIRGVIILILYTKMC